MKVSESTIARMAGNIAGGLASKADHKASGYLGAEGVAEWMHAVTVLSVSIARMVAAEVERTAPGDIGSKLKMEVDYKISLGELIPKVEHPWGHFLHARRLAMEWLSKERLYTDQDIAEVMRMDAVQVDQILKAPVER